MVFLLLLLLFLVLALGIMREQVPCNCSSRSCNRSSLLLLLLLSLLVVFLLLSSTPARLLALRSLLVLSSVLKLVSGSQPILSSNLIAAFALLLRLDVLLGSSFPDSPHFSDGLNAVRVENSALRLVEIAVVLAIFSLPARHDDLLLAPVHSEFDDFLLR